MLFPGYYFMPLSRRPYPSLWWYYKYVPVNILHFLTNSFAEEEVAKENTRGRGRGRGGRGNSRGRGGERDGSTDNRRRYNRDNDDSRPPRMQVCTWKYFWYSLLLTFNTSVRNICRTYFHILFFIQPRLLTGGGSNFKSCLKSKYYAHRYYIYISKIGLGS